MLAVIRQDKIGKSIVGGVFILMVHFFIVLEKATKMILHYNPMKINVPLFPVRTLLPMRMGRGSGAVLVPTFTRSGAGNDAVFVDFEMDFLCHT